MFVYDLERLSPPPAVVVLSACSAGKHATPAGNDAWAVALTGDKKPFPILNTQFSELFPQV